MFCPSKEIMNVNNATDAKGFFMLQCGIYLHYVQLIYILLLGKFWRRLRSTVRNKRTVMSPIITALLWMGEGELGAIHNAMHNVRTRLKNFSVLATIIKHTVTYSHVAAKVVKMIMQQ